MSASEEGRDCCLKKGVNEIRVAKRTAKEMDTSGDLR
jgi:hypothetical protein